MKLVFNLLKLPLCFKCQKMHLAITSTIQNTPLLLWDYSPQSWAIRDETTPLKQTHFVKHPCQGQEQHQMQMVSDLTTLASYASKGHQYLNNHRAFWYMLCNAKLLLIITGNLDRWQFSVYACNLQLNLAVFFLAPAASKNTCIKHTQDTKRTVNWEFSIKVLHWKTFTISGWSSTSHKIRI